jgi:hypothetical protein
MMSNPLNLVEAAETLLLWKKQDDISSVAVVDVVGVVNNISKSDTMKELAAASSKSSTTSSRYFQQKVELWLTDPSIVECYYHRRPNNSNGSGPSLSSSCSSSFMPCFRVVLYGSSEVARIEQEQIQKGDIIRLNGVTTLMKPMIPANVDSNSGSNVHINANLLSSTVFKLAYEGHAAPGIRWFCFGKCKQNVFDEDKPVPICMTTSHDRISELVEWWNNGKCRHRAASATIYTSSNSKGSVTSSRPAPHEISSLDLEVLPCRKRRLDEIQSLGMISTIQVQVTDVRCETLTSNVRHTKNKKTKQSAGTTSTTSSWKSSTVVFASVTDESTIRNTTAMTLIDTSGQLKPILKAALEQQHNINDANAPTTRRRLILTHVRAKNSNTLRGLPSCTEDLVLVPTNDTTATIVDISDDLTVNRGSQRVRNNIDDTNVAFTQEQCNEGETDDTITFVACLKDILVGGGKSLRSNNFAAFKSMSRFRRMILEDEGQIRYRNDSVLLLLVTTANTTNGNSSSSNSHKSHHSHERIYAGSDILQILCGGLDASELLEDDELCKISMDLVRSMMVESTTPTAREDVQLGWTVRGTSNNDRNKLYATKVVLV